MAGQILKRSPNKWYVRLFMGRDPQTGKRIDHNKTIHGTKKDAEAYLAKLVTARDTGTVFEQSKKTVNQYLDQWLSQAVEQRVRQRTYIDYVGILNRYVRPSLGNKMISKVTPLDIQTLYNDLKERGLSPRTIRYTHTVLHSALKQAVRWNILPNNAAEHVDLPRQVRKEMKALTPEEANTFLAEASKTRWGTLFSLAVATGMRPGEYLGLQWKDVDLKAGTVTVRRALVRIRGEGWIPEEPKTSRSRRTIPLPHSVTQALIEHRWKQSQEILAAGPNYNKMDFVFADKTGNPLSIRNLERDYFKPTLRKTGLPDIRLYDLRHSCATLLLTAGENPKIVAERLGHASVTLTLDTYSHVLPDMQRKAAEKLESILFGTA